VETGIQHGEGVDLVYASCIPYETAEAGARIAAALGVPWVADLEDPWALDEMRVQPTALHQRVDMARMRRALESAAAIVMCAPEAAERVRRELPETSDRIVTSVPIGFDGGAFRGAAPQRDDGRFRIVHTGSLLTQLGNDHRRSRKLRRVLGGTSLDVDILTRSHVFLIEAVERLLAARPDLRDRVEILFAGGFTEGDRQACAGRDFIHEAGLLSHPETVELMRSADLLFLPMQNLPPRARAGLIPYKTFEYLAARRPILAAVPDGDVRDLLEPVADATLCRPDDVAAMAAAVEHWIDRGPVREVRHDFDTDPLLELERSRCVSRIAAVLDQVLGVARPAAHAA
jgi:glycosyltransferase involved in cell wall biosynthesis